MLPLAGLAAGALVVGAVAWRWSRVRRDEAERPLEPLDPALERRLDDELARFE